MEGEIQEAVEAALAGKDGAQAGKHGGNGGATSSGGRVPYGTCLVANLPYRNDREAPDSALGKLMLVVNSHHRDPGSPSYSRDSIAGPSSLDVIAAVFSKASKMQVNTLIMPALGTYRLGNSAQTVVSSIVTRYLNSLSSRPNPYDLVITLRRSDLARSGTGLAQMRRFVRDAVALFTS